MAGPFDDERPARRQVTVVAAVGPRNGVDARGDRSAGENRAGSPTGNGHRLQGPVVDLVGHRAGRRHERDEVDRCGLRIAIAGGIGGNGVVLGSLWSGPLVDVHMEFPCDRDVRRGCERAANGGVADGGVEICRRAHRRRHAVDEVRGKERRLDGRHSRRGGGRRDLSWGGVALAVAVEINHRPIEIADLLVVDGRVVDADLVQHAVEGIAAVRLAAQRHVIRREDARRDRGIIERCDRLSVKKQRGDGALAPGHGVVPLAVGPASRQLAFDHDLIEVELQAVAHEAEGESILRVGVEVREQGLLEAGTGLEPRRQREVGGAEFTDPRIELDPGATRDTHGATGLRRARVTRLPAELAVPSAHGAGDRRHLHTRVIYGGAVVLVERPAMSRPNAGRQHDCGRSRRHGHRDRLDCADGARRIGHRVFETVGPKVAAVRLVGEMAVREKVQRALGRPTDQRRHQRRPEIIRVDVVRQYARHGVDRQHGVVDHGVRIGNGRRRRVHDCHHEGAGRDVACRVGRLARDLPRLVLREGRARFRTAGDGDRLARQVRRGDRVVHRRA